MSLVYFSPVPWASFSQRPHKFVEWFQAKHGGEVLWVDPYPTRLPALGDLRRVKSGVGTEGSSTSMAVPQWLRVIKPQALPIEPLPGSGLLNSILWRDVLIAADHYLNRDNCRLGIGKPSALALMVLKRYASAHSFYDAMDDFPAFYTGISRWAMRRREHAVATLASQILVSSSALAYRFAAHTGKVLPALNACAVETLPKSTALSAPQAPVVLGYVGTIGRWFDWPLVIALASANPQICIRIIGPMYCPPTSPLPGNIEVLPACSHSAAMLAMQRFSVGLIPFKQTELTASVDPIKYYEYRALGLPVISTCFGEMKLRSDQAGVFLISEKSNLKDLIQRALRYERSEFEIQQFRKQNSWGARFDTSGICN